MVAIELGAAVCMQDEPEDGRRRVYLYANRVCDESSRVRELNFAAKIVERICGESIIEGYPEKDDGYVHMWSILITVNKVGVGCTDISVDYHAEDGCPLEARRDMMDIYAALRKAISKGKKSKT